MSPTPEVTFTVGSRLEYLDAVHALADEMGKLAGLAEPERFSFSLAVREAATTAVLHGNGQDPGKMVTVRITLMPTALCASVQDEGDGFDFEKKDAEDPRLPENRFKTSGRGLLLIKNFVDEVTYHHQPAAGSEVRLVKHLAG